MKQRSLHSRTQRSRSSGQMQRKCRLAIGRLGDRFEHEADRAAEAVAAGRAPSFTFSSVPVHRTQRDEKPDAKTEEEKYKEAAKKVGEAFLETPPGKEITEKAEKLGDEFISTLPGKVITGAAITGAVAALAATHKELPIGIPEIPLDKIKPGLKLKITYEGPVDKPTKVVATFSFKLGPESKAAKKPAMTESEKFRAETARMQKEQFEFRQGLKTPQERAAEERALYNYVASKMKYPLTPRPSPLSFGAAGVQMGIGPAPVSSAQPPGKGGPSAGPYAPPDLKITGESETETQEPKKEEEEGKLMRKATSDSEISAAPPIVDAVLGSQGAPLDSSTRVFMESRFGFDFSKVRVHTGSMASDSARAVNAVAYTVGHDVVFAGGAFSPNTFEGKRLLAHELAHIVQQENLPEVDDGGFPPGARRLRRKEKAVTEPDPLAKALKGDDDDVRDLTNNAGWNAIELKPAEAAKLIIELLKGATLDDDEQAGLKILRKMVSKHLLDPTLESLAGEDRFGQLLDDYHGSEYRDLLELLSKEIQKNNVKALLLDEFVSMWWLNAAEERAVVVLLELTKPEDRIDLLVDKDRVDELRGDIGNRGLALRFEKVVAETGEKRWDIMSTRLTAIFTIEASESVKKGERTQKETDELLKKAAVDLSKELLDYKRRISEAQKKPKPDPGEIAEINKEFKRRLDKLLEDKKAEFGIELKYNIEFNRLLEVNWGRKWFQEDLKEIDEILSKIPYDILHLNPDLTAFALSLRDPKEPGTAGVAQKALGRIQLRGGLSLSNTSHEIGHFVHFSDQTLFDDFKKLSKWRYLDRADLPKLINDVKDREKLEKELDDDYKEKQKDPDFTGKDHELGDYVYHFDRYDSAGKYVRRHKDACFISDYAKTEPQDDFAESFSFMFDNPKALQEKCPDKYEFMLVRVLTEYRLNQQKKKVLDEFDNIAKLRGTTIHGFVMEKEIEDKYLTPMRQSLEQALDKQRTAQVDLAKKSLKAEPKPLPKEAQAEKLAEPLLEQARRFAPVAKPVVATFAHFEERVFQMAAFEIPNDLGDAFAELEGRLNKQMRDELMAVLDPVAARVLKGEDVKGAAWPELDAVGKRFEKSVDVLKPYLPVFRDSLPLRGLLFNHAIKILRSQPNNARRERIRLKLVKLNTDFKADLEKWQMDVTARVHDGKPYDKKQVKNPKTMLASYMKAETKVAKETK